MFLSIIIPHYQAPASLLQRCLRSIEAQELDVSSFPYEVLLVDDGSPIPPTSIVSNFSHLPLRLICQPHQCQGAARNKGLCEAEGEYILFLDADDYLFHGVLTPLLHLARAQQPDILRFQFRKVSDTRLSDVPQPTSVSTRDSSFDMFSGESFMLTHNLHDAPWEYIFKRDLAFSHNITFPEGVYLEDCIFTFRLHHVAKTLIQSPITAYAYYQNPQSTVNKVDREHTLALLQQHYRNLLSINELIISDTPHCDTRGLQRKRAFLTIDYIQRLCRTVTWQEIRDTYIPQLRCQGFFPLPARVDYGWKYYFFRLLTYCSLGIRLLQMTVWRLNLLKD